MIFNLGAVVHVCPSYSGTQDLVTSLGNVVKPYFKKINKERKKERKACLDYLETLPQNKNVKQDRGMIQWWNTFLVQKKTKKLGQMTLFTDSKDKNLYLTHKIFNSTFLINDLQLVSDFAVS
jgi:hypothetical protein